MSFYVILQFALQLYCAVHLFRNKRSYWWLIAIFLGGIFGCVIYLIFEVFSKGRGIGGGAGAMGNTGKMQGKLVEQEAKKKSVAELEKQLAFSDTFQNRIELGDAYYSDEKYSKAVEQYKAALKGMFHDDIAGIRKLAKAYYMLESYEDAYLAVSKLKDVGGIDQIDDHLLYALVLEKSSRIMEAHEAFEALMKRNVSVRERTEYGKFLLRADQKEKAKEQCTIILEDAKFMTAVEKKTHRAEIQWAKQESS